jgi:hypothetical protein
MRAMMAVLFGALFVAGCSSDQKPTAGLGAFAVSPISTGAVPAPGPQTDAEKLEAAAEARLAGRRSMASKVLAAIALERVTGRKPDPSRFAELR